MTNKLKVVTMSLSFLMITGCAMVSRAPVMGTLYSDLSFSEVATSTQAGNRVGMSCASTILGAFATGDASIEAARRKGGIKQITSVDGTAKSYLGLYAEYCTIVRGI